MSYIHAVTSIQPIEFSQSTAMDTAQNVQVVGRFEKVLLETLNGVNQKVNTAEASVNMLATGKPVSLHEVMIHLEEAKISLQTLMQVRNRLVESYQEVLRMQI